MNKIIKILIIVIVILALAFGVWWFFVRDKEIAEDFSGIFSQFFPSAGDVDLNGVAPGGENDIYLNQIKEGNLIKLTQGAVSGATFASSSIMYVEKSTGHIFKINPDGQNKERISNTTILKSFESFWSPDGKNLIIRYVEDAGGSLFVRDFSGAISTSSLEGIFLPANIKTMAVSPFESRIFYLTASDKTNIGTTADFKNEKKKQVLETPFGDFNAGWPSESIISLATKPSFDVEGALYFLNIKTGSFNKILGNINGLTALVSPDVGKIIYSETLGKRFITKIFGVKSKESADFNFTTLPEKCVWSKNDKNVVYCSAPTSIPQADYPDDWYQGAISFDDSIWQADLSTGESNVFLEQSDLDIVNPFLTADENYLIFTNKKDNTLWSLKLK